MYEGLRVVDLTRGIAGAYCAKLLTDLGADVVFTEPVDDVLFEYLRTSQRHTDDAAAFVEHAEIVLVGEPGHVAGPAPPVTVSITPVGHGGPDDGLDLPEEVLQARSGSLSGHGLADRTPLTVGGRLGEYVTGVFRGARRGDRVVAGVAHSGRRARRRVDARGHAADVHDGADDHDPLSRRPAGDLPVGDDPR